MNEDEAFAILERCAIEDLRCPSDAPHGPMRRGIVGRLAHAGRIRSEVFRLNWRVVTIMTGPNAGKSTKSAPGQHAPPHIVMDANGTMIGGKMQGGLTKRVGPSAPRNLSKGY